MLQRILHGATVVLSGLALLFVVVNMTLLSKNRAMQDQMVERQQRLASAQTFNSVYQSLANALATMAESKNDAQIRELLAANGLQPKAQTPAPQPAPEPTSKKKK